MARIDAFLQLGREQGCSDIHLAIGVPPMLRLQNQQHPRPLRQHQPPQVGTGRIGQGGRRVTVDRDLARGRFARKPAWHLAVAKPRELVQEAGLAHLGRRHERNAGIGQVGHMHHQFRHLLFHHWDRVHRH